MDYCYGMGLTLPAGRWQRQGIHDRDTERDCAKCHCIKGTRLEEHEIGEPHLLIQTAHTMRFIFLPVLLLVAVTRGAPSYQLYGLPLDIQDLSFGNELYAASSMYLSQAAKVKGHQYYSKCPNNYAISGVTPFSSADTYSGNLPPHAPRADNLFCVGKMRNHADHIVARTSAETIADGGPGREIARKEMRGGRTKTIFGVLPSTLGLALLTHSLLRKSIPLLLGALLPVAQVTNGTSNADGHTRSSFLINGQTPGPHFVWDEGDDVSVTVINNAGDPITIHWHGIEQYGTPWSDGVPGLAQYPIRPGENFGTIYIRPDPSKPKPFNQISNDTTILGQLKNAELNPLMLNIYDYKHYTSEYWMSEWERTDVEQLCIDNIIVNGKGQVQCPNLDEITGLAASYQKPLTKKGSRVGIRNANGRFQMYPNNTLMFPYSDSKVFTAKESDGWNSGALWDLRVSIDSHQLYFFAADGHYTQIQVATSVLIPIGERYQFFVKLDQTPGDYIIRTAAVVLPQLINGYAILSYTSTGTTGAGLVSATTLPATKTPYIDYAGGIINGGVDLITARPI
ncbi:conidial pigment biosynthesis oxidase Arb2/brown2 [Rhizoctonia solani AG-1 IA]|uniref:Conidial pigment biosynthesis oxidase Arb2/brown2 n=1 Tax=Thanatephorus cucumeris (strain AG1-IA) TaxID=983506 RepID=L8WMH9_THACA|nr:conidial pigment biosynthesis oxidase Arb2/brown2 [Rhizoctonia solani AG-1 IA]